MLETLIVCVASLLVATVIGEAAVRSIVAYSQLKYGSSSRVSELEKQLEDIRKEVKAANGKDFNTRLSACEARLNIRMY